MHLEDLPVDPQQRPPLQEPETQSLLEPQLEPSLFSAGGQCGKSVNVQGVLQGQDSTGTPRMCGQNLVSKKG